MTVKHAVTATGTNDGAKQVSVNAWNDSHVIDVLDLTAQSSDPGSPADGSIWYNSTTKQLRTRTDGVTLTIDRQRDIPQLIPVTGEVMGTSAVTNTTTTTAGAADRQDLYPFVPRADISITALSVNCTTGVASAQAKIVAYESDANDRPTNLLFESGSALDLSTTGVKSSSWTTTLRQGKTYWLGVRHSSTATISAWATGSMPHINGGSIGTAAKQSVRRTLAFGTAAANPWVWASSEIASNIAPSIWLVVA